MPIYCDESGYTGYDLLQLSQPYFVYAALSIDEAEAEEFKSYLQKKYFLQGKELKGINLTKTNNGNKAIVELYERYASQVKVVFHHKKYALACKYFEYVFEPVLSDHSKFFYHNKFHRFIANLIYVAFETSENEAEDLFLTFQNLLRGNDSVALFNFLKSKNTPQDLISMIAQFSIIHKSSLINEITTEGKPYYWILDLAQTALHGLLCLWSGQIGGLTVICDESAPLKDAVNRVSLFRELNQEVRFWDPFGDGEIALNYNLKEQIVFEDSKKCAGLQLADMFASSVYSYLMRPNDSLSLFISTYEKQIINQKNSLCITPEPGVYLTPGSIEFDFGVTALNRLLQFSKKNPKDAGRMFIDFLKTSVAAYLSDKQLP